MRKETYLQVTGFIFAFIALLHALRLVFGWEVFLGGWTVPMWFSIAGVAAAGFLAYSAFKLLK